MSDNGQHKIRIEASFATYGTRVWIDDKELHGVRNVEFSHPAGNDVPAVTIHLLPAGVEISGEGFVTFSEDSGEKWVKDYLETMEWLRKNQEEKENVIQA